ncbi:Hypothetical_protein [Hexamita inflata]|uniref:Hypothetical_protein n=1 Tax=Hexamita inflata TaxID=28002 RepID=A0AA86TS81_9EUKA|nr:Hypothetical protein HINF_LOCUS12422 [Hexamita inflata]
MAKNTNSTKTKLNLAQQNILLSAKTTSLSLNLSQCYRAGLLALIVIVQEFLSVEFYNRQQICFHLVIQLIQDVQRVTFRNTLKQLTQMFPTSNDHLLFCVLISYQIFYVFLFSYNAKQSTWTSHELIQPFCIYSLMNWIVNMFLKLPNSKRVDFSDSSKILWTFVEISSPKSLIKYFSSLFSWQSYYIWSGVINTVLHRFYITAPSAINMYCNVMFLQKNQICTIII